MNNIRKGVIVFASLIIIAYIVFIDFSDLSWSTNMMSYLGITAMVFFILAMFSAKKKSNEDYINK